MEQSPTYATTAVHDNHGGTKEIWRTFWILLILTLVELALGFWMIGMPDGAMRLSVKGTIIILMMAKAFYIVAYFMHLGSELKSLILTIIVPLVFLLWGIVAFLYDGNSFKTNRMDYDKYQKETSEKKVDSKVEKEEHSKPGALEQ
jgi:cytochrome c oxidase subunit IV